MASCFCLAVLALAQAAPSSAEFAQSFWASPTTAERDRLAGNWLAQEPNWKDVYEALRAPREYPAEAPTGYVLRQRTTADGTVFPYLILVPEDYDPTRAYPVQLVLHGGMGAPAWDPGKAAWANGWTRSEGRIMVFPAGWSEAMWWHRKQMENLEAILREVQATWHIDPNRVWGTGNSDGCAALFFIAARQPDRFAAYAGHVGPPDRLTRRDMGADGQVHLANYSGQSFHLGYGEKDRLVPFRFIRSYLELFQEHGAEVDWYSLPDRGHDLFLPDEKVQSMYAFLAKARRDPLPDNLQWATESTARYARRAWVQVDRLGASQSIPKDEQDGVLPRWGTPQQLRGATVARQPYGLVHLHREGNHIQVDSTNIEALRLFLSPAKFDFDREITVEWGGVVVFQGKVEPSAATLLHWAARDDDPYRLFPVSLSLPSPPTD